MAAFGTTLQVESWGVGALTIRTGDALRTGTVRTFWPRTGTCLEAGARDGGNGTAKGGRGGDGGATKGDGDGVLPTSCTSRNRATAQPPKHAGVREPRPHGEVGTGGATRHTGDRDKHSHGECRAKHMDRSGQGHAGRVDFVIKGTVFAALIARATGIDANSEVCAYGLNVASGDDIDAEAWPPAFDACMLEARRAPKMKPDMLLGRSIPPVVQQSSSNHSATGTFDASHLPTEADADMTDPRGLSWPQLFAESKLSLIYNFLKAIAASSVCIVGGNSAYASCAELGLRLRVYHG